MSTNQKNPFEPFLKRFSTNNVYGGSLRIRIYFFQCMLDKRNLITKESIHHTSNKIKVIIIFYSDLYYEFLQLSF